MPDWAVSNRSCTFRSATSSYPGHTLQLHDKLLSIHQPCSWHTEDGELIQKPEAAQPGRSTNCRAPRDSSPRCLGSSLHATTPSSLKLSAFRLRIAQRLLLLINSWCIFSSSHLRINSHQSAKMTERLKSIVAQISPSTSGLSAMYASTPHFPDIGMLILVQHH